MKTVNLIPARRIIARQRRRHVRRSVVICSTWAFVIAGVCATGQGLVPGAAVAGEGGLAERLDRAAHDVEVNEQQVAAAREELAAAQATLRATRSIAHQPDWSTLLALMGRATGDDVMLRSFDLQPATGQPAAAAKLGGQPRGPQPVPAKPGGFVLAVGGLAQSQLAVTQFVLRLERIGLFSRVTLLDTSREPFRDGEATSFRVECLIDVSPAAGQAKGGRP